MTPAQSKNKCAHETCRCDVPPGQLYCSPYCAQAAINPEKGVRAACRCGHPQCEDAHARPA